VPNSYNLKTFIYRLSRKPGSLDLQLPGALHVCIDCCFLLIFTELTDLFHRQQILYWSQY